MSYTRIHDGAQLELAIKLLRDFLADFKPRCEITLFLYTYNEGSVSFVCSYPERAKMLDVVQARLDRWDTNAPPVLYDPQVHGWLPCEADLEQWHTWLVAQLMARAPGMGYAMFAGNGVFAQYHANGEREGVKQMLRDVVKETRAEMA